LLSLLGVVLRVEVAEDLEPFLWGQVYTHCVCLHFAIDSRDHRTQPLDPLGQQPALVAQVPDRVGARVVHDGRDLFQGEPELLVEQDLTQPLQIGLLVDAVARRATSAG
jgi:hypothetical protein